MGTFKRPETQKKTGNGIEKDVSLGIKDVAVIIIQGLVVSMLIAWVFYNSIWAMLITPIIIFFNTKRYRSNKEAKYKKGFDREFKDLLMAVSDALESGYSIENAFADAAENLKIMYGDKSLIRKGLTEMNVKISMRVSAEQALKEFASKYPSEETVGFAQVFSFARRLGGDYVKNMRRTIEKMEEKLELKQDIAASIASKQMEFKVMCAMPVGILLYVRLSSGDFLESLYYNAAGIIVMTGCLVCYGISVFAGSKIVDIKV